MSTAPKFLRRENGAIHFACGYCSQQIEIDESGGGMEVKCPECGEHQKVPIA
jgi:DNA-directed RNA polymerase subunit RPC12/RpoP